MAHAGGSGAQAGRPAGRRTAAGPPDPAGWRPASGTAAGGARRRRGARRILAAAGAPAGITHHARLGGPAGAGAGRSGPGGGGGHAAARRRARGAGGGLLRAAAAAGGEPLLAVHLGPARQSPQPRRGGAARGDALPARHLQPARAARRPAGPPARQAKGSPPWCRSAPAKAFRPAGAPGAARRVRVIDLPLPQLPGSPVPLGRPPGLAAQDPDSPYWVRGRLARSCQPAPPPVPPPENGWCPPGRFPGFPGGRPGAGRTAGGSGRAGGALPGGLFLQVGRGGLAGRRDDLVRFRGVANLRCLTAADLGEVLAASRRDAGARRSQPVAVARFSARWRRACRWPAGRPGCWRGSPAIAPAAARWRRSPPRSKRLRAGETRAAPPAGQPACEPRSRPRSAKSWRPDALFGPAADLQPAGHPRKGAGRLGEPAAGRARLRAGRGRRRLDRRHRRAAGRAAAAPLRPALRPPGEQRPGPRPEPAPSASPPANSCSSPATTSSRRPTCSPATSPPTRTAPGRPREGRAILGLTRWPAGGTLTATMRHVDGIGAQQFSYHYLQDGEVYDFRHFYTSNVSVARAFLAERAVALLDRLPGRRLRRRRARPPARLPWPRDRLPPRRGGLPPPSLRGARVLPAPAALRRDGGAARPAPPVAREMAVDRRAAPPPPRADRPAGAALGPRPRKERAIEIAESWDAGDPPGIDDLLLALFRYAYLDGLAHAPLRRRRGPVLASYLRELLPPAIESFERAWPPPAPAYRKPTCSPSPPSPAAEVPTALHREGVRV